MLVSAVCGVSLFSTTQPINVSAERYGEKTAYGYLYYKQVDENSGWTYDYVEITGCDKSVTEVEIPAEIDGLPVMSIGSYAFSNCNALTKVIIPNGVTSIEEFAFECCENLTDITIPESVTDISANPFVGTPWCENKQNENPLIIVNGLLIDGYTCIGDIVIPNSVHKIGIAAFNDSNLTSVVIPGNVTSIESEAFHYCTKLKSVTIENGVEKIGGGAFGNCNSLKSVIIKNPECIIYDSEITFTNTATIYGYENSTAQAYAEKYGIKFEVIDESGNIKGDANQDSKIDIRDAAFIARLLAQGNGDKLPSCVDYNDDGKQNIRDAAAIARNLAGSFAK